jgi:peroxiredoxin
MFKKTLIILVLGVFAHTGLQAAGVANDAWSITPLLTGAKAPAFEAVSADGSLYSFEPDNLKRPALIIFYRGGWCPFCNLHWAELRKIEDEILAMDVDLIFLSADQPAMLSAAMEEGEKPKYHLLSDNDLSVASAFGIAFHVDDAGVKRLLDHGHDIEAASGRTHHNLPTPAVFVVNSKGVIKFKFITPDYKVRLHNDVLLAALRTMPEWRLKRPE